MEAARDEDEHTRKQAHPDLRGGRGLHSAVVSLIRSQGMSTLNPSPAVDGPAKPDRLTESENGKRPAWVDFALQESVRVTDDVPPDLAERHDEYALDENRKP